MSHANDCHCFDCIAYRAALAIRKQPIDVGPEWFLTGETTDGEPLKPFLTIETDGPGVVRPRIPPNESHFTYTCGAVQAGALVVACDCGLIRQVDRPHDYVADIQLRGWICFCGVFNGEEKERFAKCRTCEAPRPI